MIMSNKSISYSIYRIILIGVLGQILLINNVNGQFLTCYTCDGANCNASDVSTLPVTPCYAQGDSCATVFNTSGAITARGCSANLSPLANQTCATSPNQLCFSCSTSECNKATELDQYIDCLICNSYTDADCVWNPTNNSLSIKCFEKCLVAFFRLPTYSTDTVYATIRLCDSPNTLSALSLNECNNTLAGNCWSCNQSNCNTFNEPTNRLKCQFCTDDSCNETISKVCRNYMVGDKCAYVLNNNNSRISDLNCVSSFDADTISYMRALGTLLVCDGDNCNSLANVPNITVTPVSCLSCNSMNNELCATNPSQVNTTVECDDLTTTCSTITTIDGYTIRGCLSSLSKFEFSKCHNGSNYCELCNGTNCNNQLFPSDRLACYTCNSSNDTNCVSNPRDLVVCPVFSVEYYCMQYEKNNVTYRGCEFYLPGCLPFCSICTTNGCNNSTVIEEPQLPGGGGATAIRATGTAVIILSLFVQMVITIK